MRSSIRVASSKKRMLFLSFLILLLCLSIGYATLSESIKLNTVANVDKMTWDVHLENIVVREGSVAGTSTIGSDKISVSTTLDLNKPGDYYEFYVDIVNNGTIDAKLDSLVKTVITGQQKDYLNYIVTYKDYGIINKNDLLASGEKETLRILVEIKNLLNTTKLPTTAVHLDLKGTFYYIQNDEDGKVRKSNSLYNQIVKETQLDTGINFGAISSDTNGKGVYTLSKTKNKAHPVYYYRGNINNNNVIFGGHCWSILRTTQTGGIKLIYSGIPIDGVCNNTGIATEIGKSAFNDKDDDIKYVGYMYDNNTKDSTIKTYIDEWFENNLLDYQEYLEDTPFYNERDYEAGPGGTVVFAPRVRIWGTTNDFATAVPNTTIKLGAANIMDIFTVSKDLGNGALTYPVGLIIIDEIIMAGGRGYISSSNTGGHLDYFLHRNTNSWYRTMSPCVFGSSAYVFISGPAGSIHDVSITGPGGVRPVISLQPTTTYLSGDGTSNSPYIITN